MPTTIDTLQIEIQSGSDGAVRGIRELAGALKELKSSGTVTTVIKNLNNLSTALKGFSDASRAASALNTLSSSIEKLRGAGSITSIGNGLAKLPASLKSLESIKIDGVASKIRGIADAVAPLSAVKAGGLNTMLNALSKLGSVTDSLDDDKIEAFAQKIALLNAKLEPLSAKMMTIKTGFNAISTNARKATSSVKEFGDGVNTSTLNMSSFITVAQTVVDVLSSVVQQFSAFISEAIEWDGIAARFGRGFGAQAQETYEWIQRLNEEMGINVQQFMQYSSIYATMLTGFGVANEDATKMALGYTELTYDIWAGYNDVYKSFEEASEAVKSAIAGEVEPIRRAGFTIIESTLEQTAANHGLEISLANATEAEKSYLRYLTLVDQAHSQSLVGTYAKELNTAEGMMRTFSQQLKSLAQAFGSLFLPVLVKIVPYLQAFVELLEEGVRWIAGLFGVEIQDIGDTWGDYNSTATDAVENTEGVAGALDDATAAAKELKNASLGIDELNVISPPSASSGSGGSGGAGGGGSGFSDLGVDSLWDESIFDSIESQIDDIKGKLFGFYDEWKNEIAIIGGALAALGIAGLLTSLGKALQLGESFLSTVTLIKKAASTAIIITLQFALQKEAFGDFIDGEGFLSYLEALLIGGISSYILYSMWGVGGLSIGLGVTAIAAISAALEDGSIDSVEEVTVALTGLASAVGAVALAYKSLKDVGIITFFVEWAKAAAQMAPEVGWMTALFPKLGGWFASIGSGLSGAASAVGSFLAGISAPAWAAIAAVVAAIASAAYFLYENWEKVTKAFRDFADENIAPKLDEIKESWERMKTAVSDAAKAFVDAIPDGLKKTLSDIGEAIGNVVSAIGDWVASVDWIEGIGTAFEVLGGVIFAGISGPVMGAVNMLVGWAEGFVQAISGVVELVSGLVELIVSLFSGDLQGVVEAAEKIGSGIYDIFFGMYETTVGVVIDFVEGVISWFTNLWDELVGHSIVPDMINAIVEWFVSLPDKVLETVEGFVNDIIEYFENMWESVKGFIAGDDNEKAFDLSVSVGLVKNGWTSLKSWIGSIPAVSQGVSLAKSKWTSIKSWIGSITDVKQGVALAKSKWTSIKSWIGKISDVKQGVALAKSKWTTFKKWIGTINPVKQGVALSKSKWTSVKKWIGTIPTLKANVSLVKKGWKSVKSWVGDLSTKLNIKVPKIKVKWEKFEALGASLKYPTGFDLKWAANGGMFDAGSLIWAGERGAEVVANASGGKTGVMNVQQMQDAVYEGVFAAVSAAMRGTGGGEQSINVYLDGRKITATVERCQRERGATIMGNEVYSY